MTPALCAQWARPLLAAFALFGAGPAAADPPQLSWPVDCVHGRDCHIQQFVDRDPGSGAADHRCGTLSYDGHKGTDIRLVTRADMVAGVDVLAAAPGIVLGRRDGMADRAAAEPRADSAGRDCGNGVVLRHEGGWQTQYCHLARGSIAVAKGERIARGQRLGQIGLSGATAFPHLHLTLRDPAGRVIDPFDGQPQSAPCGAGGTSLWQSTPPHIEGGLLALGFSSSVPEFGAVKAGLAAEAALPRTAPALVVWAHAFGLQSGDRLRLTLSAPDGTRLAARTAEIGRPLAAAMRALGRKTRQPWPPGRYVGRATLLRGERVLSRRHGILLVVP